MSSLPGENDKDITYLRRPQQCRILLRCIVNNPGMLKGSCSLPGICMRYFAPAFSSIAAISR